MSQPPAPIPQVPEAPFGYREGGPTRILAMSERQAQIDADLARIRAKALARPKTGQVADGPDGLMITHPVLFMAALDRQIKAVELGLKVGKEAYELERVRAYLAEMSDIVGRRIAQLDPAVHAELIGDLEALNARYLVGSDG